MLAQSLGVPQATSARDGGVRVCSFLLEDVVTQRRVRLAAESSNLLQTVRGTGASDQDPIGVGG